MSASVATPRTARVLDQAVADLGLGHAVVGRRRRAEEADRADDDARPARSSAAPTGHPRATWRPRRGRPRAGSAGCQSPARSPPAQPRRRRRRSTAAAAAARCRRLSGSAIRSTSPARPRRRRRRPEAVTSSAASCTCWTAWPMATPRPAHSSISMSLRPSPMASTSAASTPSCSATWARPDALETPTGREVEPGRPADDVVGAVQAELRGQRDEVVGGGVGVADDHAADRCGHQVLDVGDDHLAGQLADRELLGDPVADPALLDRDQRGGVPLEDRLRPRARRRRSPPSPPRAAGSGRRRRRCWPRSTAARRRRAAARAGRRPGSCRAASGRWRARRGSRRHAPGVRRRRPRARSPRRSCRRPRPT